MLMLLFAAAHPLVHVNATLNAVATVLLVLGWWLIKKRGNVAGHMWSMLAAFGVSVVFLVCYLWYHYQVGSVKFTHPGAVRYAYYVILLTHVVLAAAVPLLAIVQIYFGLRAIGLYWPGRAAGDEIDDVAIYRGRHRRLAWFAYPIWLYVSVTGVLVYVMLYHLWPPEGL